MIPSLRILLSGLVLTLLSGHAEAEAQPLIATIDGENVAIAFDDRLQLVTSTQALLHCDTQLREHPECAIKQLLACYIEYDLDPCYAIGLGTDTDSIDLFGEWPAEEYHPPNPVRIEFRINAISAPYADTLFIDVDKRECWRYQDRWAWVLEGEVVRYVLTWEHGRGWHVAAWTPWLLDSNLAWPDYLGDKQDHPVADGVCGEG